MKEKVSETEMIRRLKEVTADEDKYFPGVLGSPVTFAANSAARISSVNSLFAAMRGMDADVSEETQALIRSLMADPNADHLTLVTNALTEQHAGKVLSAKMSWSFVWSHVIVRAVVSP